MANAATHEVRILDPHVVSVGEEITVMITANPNSTSCQGFIPFADFVRSHGAGTDTVTCVYRATGPTNFQEPGSPSGPGYLVYDRFEGDQDHDYQRHPARRPVRAVGHGFASRASRQTRRSS